MKHLKYFQFAVIITLMVTAVSCTVARGGYYEEDPYANNSRYYGTAPYYGNGGNYIILERNPYTGEYYPANGISAYPSRSYNYRTYDNNNRTYDRRSERNYRNDREVNNRYRNNSVDYSQQRQQQEQQQQENVNRMRSSKESVLGKKKD